MTVTTVGYGDAVPQTSAGRLVAAVAMVTGVVGISTIISIMAQVTDLPCPPSPYPTSTGEVSVTQLEAR